MTGSVSDQAGNLSFQEALTHLKNGVRMARRGWNGKDMFVELQVPDEKSKMTLPYLFLAKATQEPDKDGNHPCVVYRVPWLASQTDILADDWYTSEYQGLPIVG